MRRVNLLFLFNFLLLGVIGCIDGQQDVLPDIEINETCFSGDVVKRAKNQKGTIYYDSIEQRFAVYVTIPGTYDSQDVGFICDKLDTLKKDNLSIVFTGTYYPYLEDRQAPVAGQEYYFLDIQKFKVLEKQ
ncbi:hypothetical protein [Dyadobacter sp. CY323]|uniref:hypothetical protein n=1 Tax=Dyadobacter sp. CY323 TaxID=2907302 RepID=UPI001F2B3501|nr:hypothetical protein [Dyadobacter sp. CY323]MCE6991442.1 hypothetical protein [Dyadobacter sp. CY323]